ncbi:MAG: glycoside hydrolase family 3 protein, partial [Clostridia bacterium]|nr:glycoside hydrolase family 3 protein [Clostridia bacterium]
MDIEKLISEMTAEEKAALVAGTDFMYTNPIPRLGIPSLRMSDGPHGLRVQKEGGDNGVSESEPATAFPTAVTTASGWNPENLRKMGEAIAEECRYYGVHTVLGPGVNIKRNPLCGRNFEYFSEDPYLAGVMGAAEVDGVQSKGVGVSLKHFALNNSENYRFMGNSIASENTMRRLYLKPFEYVVKHAHPATVMCAYNQINGTYCSEHKWLLTDVLRKEWGFNGVVMSDWGAVHDRIAGLKAGLDLEMPGDTAICRKWILDSLADGTLPTEDLDNACRNILKWIDKYAKPADSAPVDWDAHHALAAEIAADCAVLMKNDGALPLSGEDKLHICGELFENMRYQGAGSSMINPARLTAPKAAFEAHGVSSVPIEECNKILVFAGLTD